MSINLITDPNKIDRIKWSAFVTDQSDGNFFQTPEYYDFNKSISQHSPFVICLTNESDEILGILVGTVQKEQGVKSYFSRRAIVYGGPLVQNNNPEYLSFILQNLKKMLRNRSIYIELRNLFSLAKSIDIFKTQGFNYLPHLNYLIPLDDNDTVWKNLSKNRIRQINKARKNGVKIKVASRIMEIHGFYKILAVLYITKINKPLPPIDFFINFFSQNLGVYILVLQSEKIIGGMMCPIDHQKIYEWYICGLDKEYEDAYPSVMATYAAIEYGLNNGLKCFDFLGAGNPEDSYGVREFKSRFGGNMVEYGRFRMILNKPLFSMGFLALYILKHIKKYL
jgi:lipid II:glycine glycyltransferase (peptidoglycan interpeptide bridge formation enzyme)